MSIRLRYLLPSALLTVGLPFQILAAEDVADTQPQYPGASAKVRVAQSDEEEALQPVTDAATGTVDVDGDQARIGFDKITVRGRGVFHIHPENGPVIGIEIAGGDLINVPRDTRHWFNLCEDRTIRCIRWSSL